ncbi:hypothetical protein [Leuconostoc pseudomesenteroides]|uniref:hypothetical protein n=1 Tax=Leuconostoc pseudomesenteroides TaxID=33968 RepID=UPI0039E99829
MKKTFKLGSETKVISRTLSNTRESIQFIKKVQLLQEKTIMDPFEDGYEESAITDLELTMIALYTQRASELLEQPEEFFESIDYFEIVEFVRQAQSFLSEQGETSGEE